MTKDMQKLKETIMKGNNYLHIKRLPENTVQEFIEFANDDKEFGGDWGVAFKYVWDMFKGTLPLKDEQLVAHLDSLQQQIIEIKEAVTKLQEKPVEKEKKIRTADGKVR
jgi:hypothetical protein